MTEDMANNTGGNVTMEVRRLDLEKNVTKSRKSLQYWQNWAVEYESMREEIYAVGQKCTDAELNRVMRDFKGEMLTEKETQELLLDNHGQQRDSRRVLGMLMRRLDYVQTNIKSLEKQVEAAEEKLLFLDVLDQNMSHEEDVLPLIEIQEKLDEDDNVISSLTTTPSEAAPNLKEVLRKAGVEDLPVNDRLDLPKTVSVNKPYYEALSHQEPSFRPSSHSADSGRKTFRDFEKPESRATDEASIPKFSPPIASSRRKSVTFAEGTKKPHCTKSPSKPKQRRNLPVRSRADVSPSAKHSSLSVPLHDILLSERDDNEIEPSPPVIPGNESPEDAALRRQMLQYGMNEVGAIVAEIELDDEETFTPPYSDEEDNYDYAGSSTDEEEDEFGRTKKRVVSEDYRRQMQGLQQRLNTIQIENSASSHDTPTYLVTQPNHAQSNDSKPAGQPKAVRFAGEVDIQYKSPSGIHNKPQTQRIPHAKPSLHDDVVERINPHNQANITSSTAKRKVSRFKSARNDIIPVNTQDTNTPSQPTSQLSGKIHKTTIIEHPPRPTTTPPLEPDDLDPALLHQEVSMEYHRLRNRMIQRQGGFMAEEEGPETRLSDEEEGAGRRVSRFKAARLGRGR